MQFVSISDNTVLAFKYRTKQFRGKIGLKFKITVMKILEFHVIKLKLKLFTATG